MWQSGETVLESIALNKFMKYGRNGIFTVSGTEGIRLPSSLTMQYPALRKVMDEDRQKWVYDIRNGVDNIYGAKVFQGLTQATARCIIAEHMLKIAKTYKVALTVHDALDMVVPEAEAEKAIAFTLQTMRTPPEWMPDIPLDAEAGYGKTLYDC